MPPARDIVPAIAELIQAFRGLGAPVVFTRFTYSPDAPLLVGELHPEHRPAVPDAPVGFGHPSSSCLVGEANVEVVPGLAPWPGELVVDKRYYDAFNGTALDGALRARGITTLVTTGTMTDICVLATVVGAFNREYRVVVVEDAVATLWPEIQRAALDIMGRAFARVLSALTAGGGRLILSGLREEEELDVLAAFGRAPGGRFEDAGWLCLVLD